MENTILITGANGQLGSEFKALKNNFPEYNFLFVGKDDLNITDKFSVKNYLKKHEVNYVINCAAYTAVDAAEEDHLRTYEINVTGPKYLAEICNKRNIILFHVSTDYAFDGKKTTDYTEEDLTVPLSVYGKTKLEGEKIIQKHCPSSYIIRTSWLYSAFNKNFVKSMLNLAKTKNELGIVADQYGSPTYAENLANTIMTMLIETNEEEEKFGIYHYSNEGVTTWCEFAKRIMEEANTGCIVKPITTDEYPLPASRPKNSSMSKDKIKNFFNIKIPNWEDSLKLCMNQILINHE